MNIVKGVLYELQPFRPLDVKLFFQWVLRTAADLYRCVPLLRRFTSLCWESIRSFSPKTVAYFLTWLAGWGCVTCFLRAGSIYFMLSAIGMMMINLDERESHSLSAYSIFNRGCRRILGTLTAEQFEKERLGNYNFEDDDEGEEEDNGFDDMWENDNNSNFKGKIKTHRTGKKSRRNYEERKRRKEAHQRLVEEQINQGIYLD